MPVVPGVTIVNIAIANNVWWTDAFQFGDTGDVTWSFTGKKFLLDVKPTSGTVTASLALDSAIPTITGLAGTIVVLDTVNRILQLNVDDHLIRTKLPVGQYVYDLVMVTISTGQRDPLMVGGLNVTQGVTIED